MSFNESSHHCRYEIKYLLPSHIRAPLQAQIAARMRVDPHGSHGPGTYVVKTYYLDSPDLTMYHEKLAGLHSRTKVRVRYYEGPRAPVKLEIKERLDNQIVKSEYKLDQKTFEMVMRGEPIPGADPSNYAISEYHRFLGHYRIRPKLHMTYLRCAYQSWLPGALRITFDTRVRVRRCLGLGDMHSPEYNFLHPQWTILEVKFTSIMPTWINELCRRFSLYNESVSKYIFGLNRLLKLGEMEDPTPLTEGFPEEEEMEEAPVLHSPRILNPVRLTTTEA